MSSGKLRRPSRGSQDKGNEKHHRHHRSSVGQRSEGESSRAAAPREEVEYSEDGMPRNFGFLWSVNAIAIAYDENYTPRHLSIGGANANERDFYWFPPERRTQFRVVKEGKLYQWRQGASSEVMNELDTSKLKYSTASLFYQARQDNFLVVDADCTRDKIRGRVRGWGQLFFQYKQPGDLSIVDFTGDKFGLSGSARGSSWLPQLLPEVYDCPTRGPRASGSVTPCGGLCGKLSILVGLAAFSTSVDDAEDVIRTSFRLRQWVHHDAPNGVGRYADRGVVVNIYRDPSAQGVTEEHLQDFEYGQYGPIFSAFESLSAEQGPPAQSRGQYSYSNYLPSRLSPEDAAPRYSPLVSGIDEGFGEDDEAVTSGQELGEPLYEDFGSEENLYD